MIATKPINAELPERDNHAASNTDLPLATVDYSDISEIDEASIPVLHEAVDAQGYSDADLGSDIDLAIEDSGVESDSTCAAPPQLATEMNIDLGFAEPDSADNPLNQKRVELQPPRGLSQFIFNIASVQSGPPLDFNNPGTTAFKTVTETGPEKPMPVTHSPTTTTAPPVELSDTAVIAKKPDPQIAADAATLHTDDIMELDMSMVHPEFHTSDSTTMMPRKENPFLPQHILNRLHGSSRSLVEEIAQSSAALEASTALLRNNKSRAAHLAPAAKAAAADDRLTLKKQKMVDDLVDDYLPLIAAELRRRLRRMLEE